jgi:PAS domain S-box-containing protein
MPFGRLPVNRKGKEENRKRGKEHRDEVTADLSERIRELNCLHEISDVIDPRGRPFSEIIEGILKVIPKIMTYPEITCARITIDGDIRQTENFRESTWHMGSDITSRCNVVGAIEVFYLEDRPKSFEGPFTESERGLLDNIASRLGRVVARKRSEEMLIESEERYRSLFEDSSDAIYTVSRDGIILDANEAAFALFGYSSTEMPGMSVLLLYATPDERTRFQEEVEKQGSVKNFEVKLRKKDGTVMECLYTSSVRRSASTGEIIGYHCIIRDITESKRLEEERQQLIEDLKSALDKIKTLRGLIPICASCKKIRDDRGFWKGLEEYIEAHSNAIFSHGLCPECQKLLEEE